MTPTTVTAGCLTLPDMAAGVASNVATMQKTIEPIIHGSGVSSQRKTAPPMVPINAARAILRSRISSDGGLAAGLYVSAAEFFSGMGSPSHRLPRGLRFLGIRLSQVWKLNGQTFPSPVCGDRRSSC